MRACNHTSPGTERPRFPWSLRVALLLAALIGLSGCLEDPTGLFGDDGPGFTPCGDFPDGEPKTCEPNNFCSDPEVSECQPGCLGNENCTTGASCVIGAQQMVGSCRDRSSVDAVQRCLDACNKLVVCGAIDDSEGNQCNNDCQAGTAQADLADCVEPWVCSEGLDACLDLECGPSYPCASGQDCVSHQCL